MSSETSFAANLTSARAASCDDLGFYSSSRFSIVHTLKWPQPARVTPLLARLQLAERLAAEREAELRALQTQNEQLKAERAHYCERVVLLEEELRWMKAQYFGTSSQKTDAAAVKLPIQKQPNAPTNAPRIRSRLVTGARHQAAKRRTMLLISGIGPQMDARYSAPSIHHSQELGMPQPARSSPVNRPGLQAHPS
jgi:hypothetical protein